MRRAGAVVTMVASVACGPSAGSLPTSPWTLAVYREVDAPGAAPEPWLVGSDGGSAERLPVPPSWDRDALPYSSWVGFTPDGRGFYLAEMDRIWRAQGGGFRSFELESGPGGTAIREESRAIAASGQVAVFREIVWTIGVSPAPRASLQMVDVDAARVDLVDLVQGRYLWPSIGAGPVAAVTEEQYREIDPAEGDPSWAVTRIPVVLRGGERIEYPESVHGIRVAPTGDALALSTNVDGRHETRVVDFDGEVLLTLEGWSSVDDWSSDGMMIGGLTATGVSTANVWTGRVDDLEVGDAAAIHWSPDGERLAVEVRCGDELPEGREILVYEGRASSPMRVEVCGGNYNRWVGWSSDADAYALRTEVDDVDGFQVASLIDGTIGPFVEGDALEFRPEPP